MAAAQKERCGRSRRKRLIAKPKTQSADAPIELRMLTQAGKAESAWVLLRPGHPLAYHMILQDEFA
jgi:hypothetical protein